LRLYSYFRSSAAYRVRVALNLKGPDYRVVPFDLLAKAQREADYAFARTHPSVQPDARA